MGSASNKVVQEYASYYSRRARISGERYDNAKYQFLCLESTKTLVRNTIREVFHIPHVDPENGYWKSCGCLAIYITRHPQTKQTTSLLFRHRFGLCIMTWLIKVLEPQTERCRTSMNPKSSTATSTQSKSTYHFLHDRDQPN